MYVPKNCPPEEAIKIAYDLGCSLRVGGAAEEDLDQYLSVWFQLFIDDPLYKYLHAGFTAGYCHDALPWRRHVEAMGVREKIRA